MGSLSLARADRLLWLGRYMERSLTTIEFVVATYDKALDSTEGNWKGQLEELGFDERSDDPLTFFQDCLFDPDNQSSLAHSIAVAYDNAVHLRDIIGSETVSYVQMGYDSVAAAQNGREPLLDLQTTVDNIMAFKGCVDDYVHDDAARNVIKSGISLERMDLCARLAYDLDDLPHQAHMLAIRTSRTGMPYDERRLRSVVDAVYAPGFPESATYESLGRILTDLANIF